VLTIYRRHRSKCPQKGDRISRRCRCTLWFKGTLFGKPYQKSAKTRNWEAAEKIRRQLEAGQQIALPNSVTLKEASERFIADLQAQNRANDTIRKYRLLFSQIEKLGANRPITEFNFDVLTQFRSVWKESPATRNKKLDRLKCFFGFCHDAGWIQANPTKAIKPASVREPMVKPFTENEQATILAKPQTRQIRCFVRILYYSALRISDACMLSPQDFDGNKIRRVNQKNQEQVFIPIPPDLKAEMDLLPLNGGYYFLQGESEKHYTQTDAWRTILNGIYKEAIPGFHAHRFRHTAAVNWLANGFTIEEVAALLGNSVKVVEKHYASFCPSRQAIVEQKMQAMWKPKLVRVK
jgi:integrase